MGDKVRRVTTRRLVREFHGGASLRALARRYGLTRRRVEERLRQWWRARRRAG